MRVFVPLSLMVAAIATACVSYDRTKGVESTWRDPAVAAPIVGETTQSDILRTLGPPSQVIGLRDQTVFYYLKEQGRGRGAVFIVYNWINEDVSYDRAIFFFDADGILLDYGLSNGSLVAAP